MRRAAFPGSFDPPTRAHVAIAHAAMTSGAVDQVDLVLSQVTLGKQGSSQQPLDVRRAALERIASSRAWLDVVVTEHSLLRDIAAGYDAVVMGADKWHQIQDPSWYGSVAARDRAIAALPRVLVVPRGGIPIVGADVLEIGPEHAHTSSTKARSGARELVAPEALEERPCGE